MYLWSRFDSAVAKNWPLRWLLHIGVVTCKIILCKTIYVFDATGNRNDDTTKLPFERKNKLSTNRNLALAWMMVLLTNQPFRASLSVSPFVVLWFCCFAVETEEPSKIKIFEFQTRPAMTVSIAMATRLPQTESALEAWHVSQLFLWWIQWLGSRDDEKVFCVHSSTNKNARLVSVVQKIRGHLFSNF